MMWCVTSSHRFRISLQQMPIFLGRIEQKEPSAITVFLKSATSPFLLKILDLYMALKCTALFSFKIINFFGGKPELFANLGDILDNYEDVKALQNCNRAGSFF